MKMKKIIAMLTAVGMLSVMAAPVSAAQEQEPSGYVTVAIEKFTLGEGYLLEPEKVPFYEGETGVEVITRAYGESNINGGSGITTGEWGAYVESFADNTKTDANIPEFIIEAADKDDDVTIDASRSGINTVDFLSAYDFCSMSGWMYVVNNEYAPSLNEYTPEDGDVLRFEFSVYGYGSDFGTDNSSWGGLESLCPSVNRDNITEYMSNSGDYYGSGVYIRALKTSSNLLSTQENIDKAADDLNYVLTSGLSMGDVNQSKEVDVFDAVLVAKSTVGKAELDEKQEVLADMNGDFEVDVFDAIAIAKETV